MTVSTTPCSCECGPYLPLDADGAAIEDAGPIASRVQTIPATGATEALDTSAYAVFDASMDEDCAFSFTNPAAAGQCTMFTLIVRGAFTPSWPASVIWPDATEPAYATPTVYVFMTVDGGTSWFGQSPGKAYA